ncbi:hypothetical protein Hypma_011172 [Hypsizygus marmoreus]|uniref:Uncharacterized protein n=1 Tax=Hypsizygus marmoreus TaxID=39966 RepID=A0A369JHG5_HYPMA|nr:hypothetical protein Hypma_011172 [Hypsizygus marmoreus]
MPMDPRRILGTSSRTVQRLTVINTAMKMRQIESFARTATIPSKQNHSIYNPSTSSSLVTASKLEPTSKRRVQTRLDADPPQNSSICQNPSRSRPNAVRVQGYNSRHLFPYDSCSLSHVSQRAFLQRAHTTAGNDVDLRSSSVSKLITVNNQLQCAVTYSTCFPSSHRTNQPLHHHSSRNLTPMNTTLTPPRATSAPISRAQRRRFTQRSNIQNTFIQHLHLRTTHGMIYDDTDYGTPTSPLQQGKLAHGNDTREILRTWIPSEAGSMCRNDERGGWESACDRAPRHNHHTQTTTPSRGRSAPPPPPGRIYTWDPRKIESKLNVRSFRAS